VDTAKVVVLSPPATLTLAGTRTAGSELLSRISAPPAGDGLSRLRVTLVEFPPTTLASAGFSPVRTTEF